MSALEPYTVQTFTRRLDVAANPTALFRRLTHGGERPHSMLLETADPVRKQPLRTLLIPAAALSITCDHDCITFDALEPGGTMLLQQLRRSGILRDEGEDTERITIACPPPFSGGTDRERLLAPSALTPLRELMRFVRPDRGDLPESILLAGVMAYDLIDRFEVLPQNSAREQHVVPDYRLYLASQVVIVDHVTQQTDIVALAFDGDAAPALDAITTIVDAILQEDELPHEDAHTYGVGDPSQASVDCEDDEFIAMVERCQSNIQAGDVFQIVPSRTFALPCTDALLAYEHLRRLNPSPYLFYFNAGAFTLFGGSPESAIRVNGPARTVEITPIAGTRPRGFTLDGEIDQELDARLEAELRLDPKETAEHMMLVDLARNDIARVSVPGSRKVAELMRVERSSHVMHLVSRVEGTLADEFDALHACQAIMNPGTLTGAPKLRAMELLRHYESTPRGHYGGMIGYLQADGTLDTGIIIRAALVVDGIARVQAGAGVVHDSVPLLEADETWRKAEAVLRAIALANADLTLTGSDTHHD